MLFICFLLFGISAAQYAPAAQYGVPIHNQARFPGGGIRPSSGSGFSGPSFPGQNSLPERVFPVAGHPVAPPTPVPGEEGSKLLDTSIDAPQPGSPIEIPKNSRVSIQDQRGQYTHGFSDEAGTKVSEQGSLLSTNEGWEYVIVKKGSYSYISPEGVPITVNYIADHNGFRVL